MTARAGHLDEAGVRFNQESQLAFPNLVKSRGREIGLQNDQMALKCDAACQISEPFNNSCYRSRSPRTWRDLRKPADFPLMKRTPAITIPWLETNRCIATDWRQDTCRCRLNTMLWWVFPGLSMRRRDASANVDTNIQLTKYLLTLIVMFWAVSSTLKDVVKLTC